MTLLFSLSSTDSISSARDNIKTSARESSRDQAQTSTGNSKRTPAKEKSPVMRRKEAREGSTLHVVHEEEGPLSDEELLAKLKPKVIAECTFHS